MYTLFPHVCVCPRLFVGIKTQLLKLLEPASNHDMLFFIAMKWLFKPHENGRNGVTGQCCHWLVGFCRADMDQTQSFQKLRFCFLAIFFGTYSRIRLTKWTIPSLHKVLTWLPLDGCWQRGLMVSSNRASFPFLPVLSACLGVAKQLSS